MKAAVVVFPGSNCDSDCWHVLKDVAKAKVEYVWHKEASLPDSELVILPGGFSYGDYLRCGAVARFSPVMEAVRSHVTVFRSFLKSVFSPAQCFETVHSDLFANT
jgi:phosphoribosylformylglycinamidine synthase subunit PurQ / glutaminase